MLFPTIDDSDGLGRNIAYAQQARQNRFRDVLSRMAQAQQPSIAPGGPQSMIGGPLADPSWDAYFGAMHDARDRAADEGMRFRALPPSLAGLHAALHGLSPLDSQYTENPLNPLNAQYDLNTQAAMTGRRRGQ